MKKQGVMTIMIMMIIISEFVHCHSCAQGFNWWRSRRKSESGPEGQFVRQRKDPRSFWSRGGGENTPRGGSRREANSAMAPILFVYRLWPHPPMKILRSI